MLTLPRQVLVRQRLASHALADPAREVTERLARLSSEPWAGRKVAVGAGSRGIDRIAVVVRAVVDWLRAQGAEPFIIPAMGSHGGGTPEGQRALLASYGITDATMGAPIRDDVTTRQLGETASGIAVHASTVALDADAVVLINRVKPHTDFSSAALGSGLRKMCGIGLGKVTGATTCHLAASRLGHERVIREVAAVVASKLPRLYGVGLVEDGTHHLAKVEALRGSEFETREPEMFTQAWAWMPSLPLPEVDVLVVDEIGKDISGCGMDTNIIGRGVDTMPMTNRRATVHAIYARSLDARIARERRGHRTRRRGVEPPGVADGSTRQLHQRAVGDDAGHGQNLDQFSDRRRMPAGSLASCRACRRNPRRSSGSGIRWRSSTSWCRRLVSPRWLTEPTSSRSGHPRTGRSTRPATSMSRPISLRVSTSHDFASF